MSRHETTTRVGRTMDHDAWCEECSKQFPMTADRYGASKAARRHTEETGHTTTLDRSSSVWIEAVPSPDDATRETR